MLIAQLFATRLKAARKNKNISLKAAGQVPYTQERLGIAAGISEETAAARISQYENGVHMPDLSMAARLASALDVPLAYLFCAENDLAELLILAFRLKASEKKALCNYLSQLQPHSIK